MSLKTLFFFLREACGANTLHLGRVLTDIREEEDGAFRLDFEGSESASARLVLARTYSVKI